MGGTNFSDAIPGATVTHYFTNSSGDWILVRSSVANIPSAAAGYATGCMLQASDTGNLYTNTGSNTSSTFTLLEDAGGTFTLPTTATDASTTTGTSFALTTSALTTGNGENITAAALTTGSAYKATLGTSLTTGGAFNAALGAAVTGYGLSITTTGVYTGAGLTQVTADSATTGTIEAISANGLTTGHGITITSSGVIVTTGDLLALTASGATTSTGLLRVTANALTTGTLAALTSSSADTGTRTLVQVSNSGTASVNVTPLNISNNAVTGTGLKFVKIWSASQSSKTVTMWFSIDATTPNGNLTGVAGDICLNGPSSRSFYCTGTTNWTASNA